MRQRLLVLELWGIGDLALATPFIAEACESYDVSVIGKPFAVTFQKQFWPDARLLPIVAPWTSFDSKYQLHRWPWGELVYEITTCRASRFDIAVSARPDPRDHLLMLLAGASKRIGYPRAGSAILLTDPLTPRPLHRADAWRKIAESVGVAVQSDHLVRNAGQSTDVLIHSGAAQPVRVWPVERYARLASRLRSEGFTVTVACDSNQRGEWNSLGEDAISPASVDELFDTVGSVGMFVGNDSGPGHVAALSGVPTFTIFGPQLPEAFAPRNPESEWIDGKPCIYKPCRDNCRYPEPYCILNLSEDEVWERVLKFAMSHRAGP